MIKALAAATTCALLLGGLVACEEKGPAEKIGMKVDHGIDTVKNGGEEPMKDKAQDAAENVKEGVKDAADDLKK